VDARVGIELGVAFGPSVLDGVGAPVGADEVGARVGIGLGAVDGTKLGAADGDADGNADGDADGVAVGDTDEGAALSL
jgi:hypothetical protein